MAAKAKSKRDFSLLKHPDGSFMEQVTPEVAAQFLELTRSEIQYLMKNGALTNEGFRKQRRIFVSTLLEYDQYKWEKRSANAKKGWELTPDEHSARVNKLSASRWEKLSAEERTAAAKAREANKAEEERKAVASKGGKALWADKTPEERSAILKARWAEVAPGVQSANGKKGNSARWAATTPEQRRDFAKVHFTSEHRRAGGKKRWVKVPSDERSAMAKERAAKIPPERRTAISKARWKGLTQEQRSAPGKKGGKAAWAGKTEEDHKAWGKNMAERRKAKLRAEIERELGLKHVVAARPRRAPARRVDAPAIAAKRSGRRPGSISKKTQKINELLSENPSLTLSDLAKKLYPSEWLNAKAKKQRQLRERVRGPRDRFLKGLGKKTHIVVAQQ
jgi:hypothetical protein